MGHYRSVCEGDWHKEVARLLLHLRHYDTPAGSGVDWDIIAAPINGQAHGDHSLFGGIQWHVPLSHPQPTDEKGEK